MQDTQQRDAVDVFVGGDVGKGQHHAVALDRNGKRLYNKALPNDEAKLRALIAELKTHGRLLFVVDQPSTIGALPVAVARAEGVLVAYLPGLAMRRIADLHAGEAKTDARDAATIVKPRLAQQLAALRQQRDEVAAEVERLVLAHPLWLVLTSMPGVGVRTAARLLTEVAHKAFASAAHLAAHLAAYAGLAPVTRRSGSSIRGEHPSRRGNKVPKRALFLSAFAALRDPVSRAYYSRKIQQGKRRNQALIALARRRCDVLFAMLRDSTIYQPKSAPNA